MINLHQIADAIEQSKKDLIIYNAINKSDILDDVVSKLSDIITILYAKNAGLIKDE